MLNLLVATGNIGKLREIETLLSELPFRVLSLADFPQVVLPPETGETFAENARAKALAAVNAVGVPSLADDSGLEVDALDGRPGVYSSRFGGEGASDHDKCLLLLKLLEGIPEERRTARFRAAIAVAWPGREVVVVEGVCEGRIAFAPRGTGGFGYDPVFYLPELGKTMAELSTEEKNAISHRGKALRSIRKVLAEIVGENSG